MARSSPNVDQYQQFLRFSFPFIIHPPRHHDNQCHPSLEYNNENKTFLLSPEFFKFLKKIIFEQKQFLNCKEGNTVCISASRGTVKDRSDISAI